MTKQLRARILTILVGRHCSVGIESFCAMRWKRKALRFTTPSGGTLITRTGSITGLATWGSRGSWGFSISDRPIKPLICSRQGITRGEMPSLEQIQKKRIQHAELAKEE